MAQERPLSNLDSIRKYGFGTWVAGRITGHPIETLVVTDEQRKEALAASQETQLDKYAKALQELDDDLRNH